MIELEPETLSSIKIVKLFEIDYLIISANTDGLLIYELYSNGTMQKVTHTINEELSKVDEINITDTALVESNLYCLDYN